MVGQNTFTISGINIMESGGEAVPPLIVGLTVWSQNPTLLLVGIEAVVCVWLKFFLVQCPLGVFTDQLEFTDQVEFADQLHSSL